MAQAQIIAIDLGTVPAGAVDFNLEYSADGATTWTPYSTATDSPTVPEDLAASLLSGTIYTLDGVNSPTGNMDTASLEGLIYRGRWKSPAGYGNWSLVFAAAGAPAGRTAYPGGGDLVRSLLNAGFSGDLAGNLDTDTAIAAGILQFERDVRRKMLAGTSTTRYYDPPTNKHRVLFLMEGGGPGDLVGTITVAYQPVGQAAVSTFTNGTDYRLLPRNAVADDQPYDRIEFYNRYWSDPQAPSLRGSVQVTGQWGRSATTIPEDAWLAMLARASWLLFPQIAQNVTGGLLSWKEGDISEDTGVEPWKRLVDGWNSTYQAAVKNYLKIVLM